MILLLLFLALCAGCLCPHRPAGTDTVCLLGVGVWIFGRAPHVKQELVKSKSSLYAQMDKTWNVEIALA